MGPPVGIHQRRCPTEAEGPGPVAVLRVVSVSPSGISRLLIGAEPCLLESERLEDLVGHVIAVRGPRGFLDHHPRDDESHVAI